MLDLNTCVASLHYANVQRSAVRNHASTQAVRVVERHKAKSKGRCGRELANSSGCRASCLFPEGTTWSVVCAQRKRGASFVGGNQR